jgi:hypothetical protein
MGPRLMLAGTAFLSTFAYLVLGASVQATMGAIKWNDVGPMILLSILGGAIVAGVAVGLAAGAGLPKPIPAGTRYVPSRTMKAASLAVIAIAAVGGLRLAYSNVSEDRARVQAAKDAITKARAAEAALTPEQRAARAAQQVAQAAAAARAASSRIAAAAKQKTDRDAENARLRMSAAGAMALKSAMKDPEAFELRSAIAMPNGASCYEYRGKNSFGAVLPSAAILTSKGKLLVQESDGNAFVNAWNKECAGTNGQEMEPLFRQLGLI